MEEIKRQTEAEPFPEFMGMWLKTGTFQVCGVTGHPTWHHVKTNLRETKGMNVKRRTAGVQEKWRNNLIVLEQKNP